MLSKLIRSLPWEKTTIYPNVPFLNSINRFVENKSNLLVNNVWYFALFMLTTIIGILVFYSQTQNEVVPAIILSGLWLLFWNQSTFNGKIILIIASVFGYIHELIGVQHGYFTYLGGVIGGAPIWLIPGYGAIFWSSYNLWKIFHERYAQKQWFHRVNYFIVASFALLFVVDYAIFDLSLQPVAIMMKFSLALMLFNSLDSLRLAYFTGFFTVLTEFTGETLGTWTHPEFSFFSLMAGYLFLLWICTTLGDVIKRKKKWGRIEGPAAFTLTSFYILLLLGIVAV
ncbi:hypothetical protein [Methanolobus sp. WCC5]|uniref:hypothetical protein n=1 Tax=Methanolobus sp. WCC5 TaxID=3125785 RepID=UPI003252C465